MCAGEREGVGVFKTKHGVWQSTFEVIERETPSVIHM